MWIPAGTSYLTGSGPELPVAGVPVSAMQSRGGATRTLNRWFWRPVLYQLSYTPIRNRLTRIHLVSGWPICSKRTGQANDLALLLSRFLVRRVLPFLAAVLFQFQPIGATRFFVRAIVPRCTRGAFQPDEFAHVSMPHSSPPPSLLGGGKKYRRAYAPPLLTPGSSSRRPSPPSCHLRGSRTAILRPWRSASPRSAPP